jgi:regulatory protein
MPDEPKRPRKQRSLLARALSYLARREHSRAELLRKLRPHAASEEELSAALDRLQADDLLSDRRFAEVLTRTRGERSGTALVRQELVAHGVEESIVRQSVQQLQATEFERARRLWERRFGQAAADPHERARQARFLAGRGFSADVVRRVTGGRDDE